MNSIRPWQRTIRKRGPTTPIPIDRVERWLGVDKVRHLQDCMRGWYGSPINIVDMPGSVWITKDGEFVGKFNRGYFASAYDAFADYLKANWRELGKPQYGMAYAGFASISDALSRASQGYSQRIQFNKSGSTGVVAVTSSLWRVGPQPVAGSAGAAAPGGTAHTSSNTGAMAYANPAAGTMHLVGADVATSVINNSLLLYDRLFSVAKTMNSTSTESVTGVPTRYQSTTATNADYIGDNFGFVEVGGTALAATAHNWTTCTYTDQANASSTLPSLTGNSGAIVDRLDHPTNQWFAPLESGDVGIKAWTQMQCSAAVATGAINFVIGHPLGFMSFPVINSVLPFDWLTNRDQAPRIFDSACLAFLEPLKPATTATTYVGRVVMTNAAA
ncbi:MAG TPA: hypothetical protein PLV92_19680 [Pirellulaceae bacterium]|nr:hypothetical protein [Pirellulaceae bacterium]